MTRDPKFSYTFGVSVRHEFNKRLSLKALLLAEKKGTIMKYDIYLFDEETQTSKLGSAKQDYTYKYYTLSLPVIYALGKGKQVKIGFGPYISYLKRQDIKTTYSDGVIGHTDQTEVNRPIDLGCSAFISHTLSLTEKICLNLTLLQNLGLFNTRADEDYGVIKTYDANLLFGIEYKLNALKR